MINKNPTFYIEDEKLAHFAENTARLLKVSGEGCARGASFVAEALRKIRAAVRASEEYAARGGAMPKSAEWLTDNWYIAEREGKDALRELKGIGKTRGASGEGGSVVACAATELVRSGAGRVTAERISIFLEGFQSVIVLRERELAIFIPSVKAALLAELSCVAVKTEEILKRSPKDRKAAGEETQLAETAERAVSSLRMLSATDVFKILEEVNITERALRKDPSGVYPKMDDKTRLYYRRRVSALSRKTGIEEHRLARRVVELSKSGEGKRAHVGYYLFENPLGAGAKRRNGSVYIASITLLSLFFALLLGFALKSPVVPVILLIPISEVIKNVQDFLIIKLTRPRLTPKLELEGGIPDEGKTLCVISALLTSEDACTECAARLEEYYLSNRDSGKNLLFGVLADLPESRVEWDERDAERLEKVKSELTKLDEKYGGFYLFARDRRFSQCNGRYMGWERKRGALLELVRLLSGAETELHAETGDVRALAGTKYVITLDSDTRLGVGTARELVGAMLHPLGRAVVDEKTRTVSEGHAILQPRVSVDLKAANRTDFTRLFAGQGGIDPYGSTAGDVYHDLFDRGSFMGKGIIDVAAYNACLDGRFPENLILSHDLLEGEYLRAGFAGDVELTDGYPCRVSSFYERQHRWTRGDWQLVRWLFASVPGEDGERVRNPLGQVSRWKIFDNLRRSTVPVFTFLAVYIGMLTSGRAFAAAGAVAVLSAVSALLISTAELIFRRDISSKARYHSTIISGFGAALTQTLIQLVFLPYQAYVSLHAIITALYRMYVSKKNLLSWVTAAESEKKKSEDLLAYCRRMYAPMLLGLAAIFLSPWAAGAAAGAVWLFSPVCALSLGVEKSRKAALTQEERLFVVRAASESYRYFTELTGEENNFLPPDNFQEQPYVGAAERVSPTNIALALLSAQAAVDMELRGADGAHELIEHILDTVERLPKWNGHLYNWYDSKTLRPLDPPYISTVDSGNLAGALITLREALLESGDKYKALAQRADALAAAMNFTLLFDEKRQLFYIGLEADGTPTKGWYDLMASEARQTSYIAVARGQVGRKHWRRLGRALVSKDNFSGMASWTGTMFEYLMPDLIMPSFENSLLYESMKFCIYVQRKAHTPWGMSESAFYSFDPNMNYRYKAHGAARLALKRGQDRDCVISPYSTFLALPLSPKSSVKNLRRLAEMGMEGRYGYCEAADFTPSRQLGGSFEIVRSYMAHHLGMSIVAADNAVNDGVMQKRFMRDREMAAYSELLQERVPVGQIVLKKVSREVPEAPRTMTRPGYCVTGEGTNPENPACTLLSNGAYTVALAGTGASRSMLGEMLVSRFDGPYAGARGPGFFLKSGESFFSLQPSPDFSDETKFFFKLTDRFGETRARNGGFETRVDVRVSPEQNGEKRTVTVKNTRGETVDALLAFYFEPVLAKSADYLAHPAFMKLAIETSLQDGALIVTRRSDGRKKGAALAVLCDRETTFDTMREAALGRGGERSLKSALLRPAGGTLGAVVDPCVLVRVPIRLKPSEETRVSFALCAADGAEEAAKGAAEILRLPDGKAAARVDAAARALSCDGADIALSMEFLRAMAFKREGCRERALGMGASGAREAMWRLGVSGDIPIITAVADGEDARDRAVRVIKSHLLLRRSGVKSDLVLVTNDGGDYRRPVRTMLGGIFRELGLEPEQGDGIFLADEASLAELMCASAKVIYCSGKTERCDEVPAANDVPFWKEALAPTGALTLSFDEDGCAVIDTGGALPQASWSNILTFGGFGAIASDCGTGHMWYKNAREDKMNVWQNDLLATDGTERLTALVGGRAYSLFADADGIPCRIRFGFGFAEWKKEIRGVKFRVTAFVPPETDARVLLIRAEGGECEISYFTDIVMGAESVQNGTRVTRSGGIIVAENRGSAEFPGVRFVTAFSEKLTEFSNASAASQTPFCVNAKFELNGTAVIVSGVDSEEKISALLNPEAASAALDETKSRWQSTLGVLQIETPDESLDRYMNGWALYQTLASRILGRTSMYQNGGAYGFRDQLQDVSCIVQHYPQTAREQIVRAAEHQYTEGDVQHWWHPKIATEKCDRGVRTRFTDDLLWLPYALCRYFDVTGDLNFCGEAAEYITSPPLKSGERERYEQPQKSGVRESVFEHAKRALDLALSRGAGEHGLALIGGGDWNDGFDRLGAGGKGESVWLTWFLASVSESFSQLCAALEKHADAEKYERAAKDFAAAANAAWDGEWFKRAYFDDGAPIGAAGNAECEIDSIAQSFSAWTDFADGERSVTAIKSAVSRLFDRQNGVVMLFTPPFTGRGSDPGYIRGYVPGVRENGGQYTHAAIWLAMSCLERGLRSEGWEILQTLLPLTHDPAIYKVEPFVLPADVYSNPQQQGRGGWSWYTGAAAWYFRAVEEELLGLKMRGGRLKIEPRLPDSWEGFHALWRTENAEFDITVKRTGKNSKSVDKEMIEGDVINVYHYKGKHGIFIEIV